MSAKNNAVFDMNKVQYARFFYRNQWGDTRVKKPKYSTYGVEFNPSELAFVNTSNDKKMTLLEKAKQLGILDVWTPVIRLQFAANHSLIYIGAKALSIRDAWNAKQFKPKKDKH